jgi:hypothetical protein
VLTLKVVAGQMVLYAVGRSVVIRNEVLGHIMEEAGTPMTRTFRGWKRDFQKSFTGVGVVGQSLLAITLSGGSCSRCCVVGPRVSEGRVGAAFNRKIRAVGHKVPVFRKSLTREMFRKKIPETAIDLSNCPEENEYGQTKKNLIKIHRVIQALNTQISG